MYRKIEQTTDIQYEHAKEKKDLIKDSNGIDRNVKRKGRY